MGNKHGNINVELQNFSTSVEIRNMTTRVRVKEGHTKSVQINNHRAFVLMQEEMRRASQAAKKFSKPTHYKSNVFPGRSIQMHFRVQKEFCSFIIYTLDGGSG